MTKIRTATAELYCKMGSEVTPIYLLSKKKWFDKKIIERVLTGKNQHNLLGQATDPKNHMVVIDGESLRMIEIISESGVRNYLKRARSVKDECKKDFYDGLKKITPDKPVFEGKEPLQPLLQMIPYVRIDRQMDGSLNVKYWNGESDSEAQKKTALSMLTEAITTLVNQK